MAINLIHMETVKIISIVIVIAMLLAVREGFSLRDRIDPGKGYSKAWHWFGFLIRLLLAGIMFQATFNWWLTGIVVVIIWPVYNIACNIGLKKKWYYLSNKGIDGVIRKLLPFIRFDK